MTNAIARWWRRHQPRWLRNYQFPLVTRGWARREAIRARKAALDPIIRKGARIRAGIVDTPLGETYRCQVDFDPFLFRQMFVFGNKEYAIKLIAERLAYQVESEINRLNWYRFPYSAAEDPR